LRGKRKKVYQIIKRYIVGAFLVSSVMVLPLVVWALEEERYPQPKDGIYMLKNIYVNEEANFVETGAYTDSVVALGFKAFFTEPWLWDVSIRLTPGGYLAEIIGVDMDVRGQRWTVDNRGEMLRWQ
jgi:hypothetical protein